VNQVLNAASGDVREAQDYQSAGVGSTIGSLAWFNSDGHRIEEQRG